MSLRVRVVLAASLAIVLAAAAFVFAEGGIDLDAPHGGWRDGSRERAPADGAVYPAPLTDHGIHRAAALIRGRIAHAGPKPWTLIVNGNPVPLATDAGVFARPWAFGPGSNSVEIRGADGRARRLQFYETSAGKTPVRLRVILGWDTRATDVDLHVITPDGAHASYRTPVLPNGGAIDVDERDAGPEIFSMPAPLRGTYLLFVNYFGRGHRATQPLVTATVTVITEENTVDEKRETSVMPLRKPGDLVLARTVRY